MKRLFTLFAFLLFSLGAVFAQTTYTSIADGAVNNPAIWSLDGGVTPCSCIPVSEAPGLSVFNLGSVEIFHQITAPKNMAILGNNLSITVNAGASLTGTTELDVRAGVFNNMGTLILSQVRVFNSGFFRSTGFLRVNPGNLANEFQGRMQLGDEVTVNGNLTNNGFLRVLRDARVAVNGEIVNDAFFDTEPNVCINVAGDFLNNLDVNLVDGPGTAYVESGNNITNGGSWSANVNWCAAGAGVGLVHAANCTSCFLLPVELLSFEAAVTDGIVELDWQTATETSNSHFTIERSANGTDFEAFMEVSSTSPAGGQSYTIQDPAPFYGVSWYRLSQTDYNGATTQLRTAAVLNNNTPVKRFQAFPNPFGSSIKITTVGMEGAPVEISLTDLYGRVISKETINHTADHAVYTLQAGDLPTGLYQVTISGVLANGTRVSESFRMVHP